MRPNTDLEVLALVRARLARRLGEDEALPWLSDTESLAAAGVDSVLLIGVISELEQELGVALSDDAVLESSSIGSLAAELNRGSQR